MLQFSKNHKRFFAALLGVLLILNSLSILNPAVVYGAEGEVVESVSEDQEESLAEGDAVEEGDEVAEPESDSEEAEDAEEIAESEEEPEEEAEEADPEEEAATDETEDEAVESEDEVVEEEEAAEVEEEEEPQEEAEEEPQEEAEEEPETLAEEDVDDFDYPKYLADNDGTTVLAFTSDIHNGTASGGENNVSNNRLTTWLGKVMPMYGNHIGVMGFCGDMAAASSNSSTFWTFTQTVMNNVESNHGMDGVYAVGNHEYMNGNFDTTSNSPEVRNKYKLNAEGRAVSGENYVMYCLGTDSGHGTNWAYENSQVTSLTNYLASAPQDKVIIVLTHFPLHDYGSHRTSNTDPVLKALNAAAVGSDGTYGTADDKKIVFLWGHNHSEGDNNYDQVWGPGDKINDNNKSTVYFYYAAAGCMADSEYGQSARVLGKGLVLTINSKKQLSFTYYDASGNNVTEGGTYTEQDPVAATGVSIDEKNPSVDEGRKIQLHLTYTPSDANTNMGVTWSSSNTAIATVNSSGMVTGVKEGTATITVRAADGSYSDSTVVTVNHNDNPNVEETINITPTTSNPEETININVGDTLIINVTNSSTNSAYDFTASMNKSGIVQNEGNATINIAANNGTGTFTFTGVADGKVDITIQNTNQYGSSYVRKGTIHVIVGDGGSDTPPVGDNVYIEPTTDNPEEEIAIAVGDTLTINVTNGSSNSAYDFTMTISDSSIVQAVGSTTINIAAGATAQFTVTGLKNGTADVTIQNENQYGSQYVRKGIVHVTVGEYTPPEPGEGTNYKLVDHFSANKEYLIVNRNTAGSGYALTSPGGTSDGATMGRTSVTVLNGDVDGDGTSDIYITSEATAIVWKTGDEISIYTDAHGDFGKGFDLSNANPGGYLEGRQGNIKVYSSLSYNVTGNRRGWRYTDGYQLQHVGGDNVYTLQYNNGFEVNYNENTNKVYLFEKTDGTTHEHTWGEWTVTTPATCTVDGVETRTCSGCGQTETRAIAATGHTWGEWVETTPATCTAKGVETRTCSKCGETETRDIDMIAHTYGEPTWEWTGSDAEGYTAAVAKFTCSVCGDVQTVNASLNTAETSVSIIYIASVSFQGKSYLDTKNVSTVPVTYELSDTAIEVPNNSTYQLTLNGSDGSTGTGTWVSADEKIATVDENGLVTAVKYGKTTITVTFESDGKETTATCEVQTRFSDVTDSSAYYYKAVYWAADSNPVITAGYTSGDLAGSFGVGRACTRQEFILFIYRLAGQPKVSNAELDALEDKFTDASELTGSFKKAVAWGVKNGIIKGYTSGENAGKFVPGNDVTRQEALLMLWRYAGKPSAKETDLFKSFKDLKGVKKTSDTYNSIKWSVAKGISKGYAEQANIPEEYQSEFEAPCFGTTMKCQRQDLILFLYRYAK